MKNILYFVLLISLFGSLATFTVEIQKTKNKKINDILDEEDYISMLAKLHHLEILDEEDIETDESLEKATNKNNKEHDEYSLPELLDIKTLDEETLDMIHRHLINPIDDEKSLEEKQERDTQKSTNQTGIDLNKKSNEVSPPEQQIIQELPKKQNSDPSDADENAAHLQKADQKKESELAIDKMPQNKENTYKTDNQKKNIQRLEKPIVAKSKEENERKKLQQWLELKRDRIGGWARENSHSKLIYKRQYDSLNEHLPTSVFVHDYSKQLFYCIKKNNLSCLRGIINKLEKIGLSIEESLKSRNKLGDTPLIYAAKWGEIDMVRFLLLQGSELNSVNYNFQSAMDIAITKKHVGIINAIAEMTPRLVEHKKINNKKDSAMYNWAIKTKKDNESKCDADY
ncbi:Ankyrin repeat-containing domain,Ankyrin repeat [Cinara cedri]|uniref:Ankyrin repeat-containing domain,Ankyrin repeat n=1 Tax=Cinara cedri TaxID=506608 RepID=A0A5E4NGD4_9HEMI|nr:Ankyrin repeat-containing domain,Ankyrin repeat [Cinara cedri]